MKNLSVPKILPIKILGSGSFGYVLLALDIISLKPIAIKRIKKVSDHISR